MTPRFLEISLRQIETHGWEARPGLLDELEKTPSAAAGIEKPEVSLIAAGENFMDRRQGLPPRRICRTIEKHLDLQVVSPGRFVRQIAPGLKMEVLQIVGRPLAGNLRGQHFIVMSSLPAAMNAGQIREE